MSTIIPSFSFFLLKNIKLDNVHEECPILRHTGISCQNFFHSTIIPAWKVSWVSKEAKKLKELEFVCLVCCFSAKMEWDSKKLKKIIKIHWKVAVFGIFSKFVQFWLKNSGPNQLDELKWIILLLLTPKPSLEVE